MPLAFEQSMRPIEPPDKFPLYEHRSFSKEKLARMRDDAPAPES
jgi:hypothetical protein